MWGRSKYSAAVVLAMSMWLAPSSANAACHLGKYFDLPVEMEGRAAVATTKINGQEARFEIDTGAFFSMLTPDAAARLNTRPVPVSNLRIQGIGGDVDARAAEADTFNFGGIPLKHVQFIVGGREFARGAVGLLGENVLNFADQEYDFAHGMIRFFKADDCKNTALAYWSEGNYGVMPIERFEMPNATDIKGVVKINGHAVRAIFDSGSGSTILTRRAAERAGIKLDGADVKPGGLMGGIGKKVVETWSTPVESFAIGDEEIKNTRLLVGKLDLGDIDMILGADFFLSHRLYVARGQNKLYFSYNGGSVFRLDQAPKVVGEAVSGAAADAPTTADALRRQGLALMARRDYAGALKAFDAAVALEPKAPTRYLDRARAHEALGKRDLAMADLDQALQLKPDDAIALVGRGALRAAAGDLTLAAQDFAAALKAAPGDSHIGLSIAAVYERKHMWTEAIVYYDAWIAAHAKDDGLWGALNDRCWARAMLGKGLEKALDDCNASIKRGPRNSPALDSRGMVHLRMGQLHEALDDYNAALKLQPKLPWALYGRGLAKQRLGMKAEGDADIAAALAQDPTLETQAREIGLIEGKAEPAKAEAKPKA